MKNILLLLWFLLISSFVFSQQQTLCSLNYIPDGWAITDVIKNCQANACKGKSNTCWIITNLTSLPTGSILRICPFNNIPSGWVVDEKIYCNCCGATQPGAGLQWVIRKTSAGPVTTPVSGSIQSAPVKSSSQKSSTILPVNLPKSPKVIPGGRGDLYERSKTIDNIDLNNFDCSTSGSGIRHTIAEECMYGNVKACRVVSACYQWCSRQVNNDIDKQIYLKASDLFKQLGELQNEYRDPWISESSEAQFKKKISDMKEKISSTVDIRDL